MDGTSATTNNIKPMSLETLTRAMQENDLLPQPDQWIVIDPQGRMYKGKVEEVIQILLAEHPLLKRLSMFPFERGAPDV